MTTLFRIYAAIGLVLVIVTIGVPAAEDARITAIRSLYQKAKALDCGDGCGHYVHELRMNTMMPAIGLQTTVIRFIYTSEQENPGRDPYLLRHRLHLVTVSYTIAASAHYRIEYLFDERGALVFHLWSEKGAAPKPREKRLYYHNRQLIQALVSDDAAVPSAYAAVKNFAPADVAASRRALESAERHRQTFSAALAAERAK